MVTNYELNEQLMHERFRIDLVQPTYSGETISLEISRFYIEEDVDEGAHWSPFYVKVLKSPFVDEYNKDMLKAMIKAIDYVEKKSKNRK